MSVLDSISKQVVPIHPAGYPFIIAFAVGSLVLHWIWPPLGWVGALLTVWCVYFFRDPPRVTPLREGLVVSPADGYVCSVGRFVPPPELELGDLPMQRICVFMSVFDCHVNRAPVSGRITRVAELPGDAMLIRSLKKAAQLNASGEGTRPAYKPKPAPAVPADLAAALKKNPPAAAAFDKFSPSHRREYIEWITEAKREETRAKRLATTLEWLAEGKSRHWKYANC